MKSRDKFIEARKQMILRDLKSRNITDEKILNIMDHVKREDFVPAQYRLDAYMDTPLPIGMGQTISQPYIVALMTQHLMVMSENEVLEIGTGSGYQTAILAKLAKKVYTVEKYNQLSEHAQTVLARADISNIDFFIGDGSKGWPKEKTFDRIMITAAMPKMPKPIIDQLSQNGILVAPVGGQFYQNLVVCRKAKGKLTEHAVCGCRFVPLIGKYGFAETKDSSE